MLLRQRLGDELRRLREDRSLRLQDVAGHLGVVPGTLSRIEAGKAPARTSYVAIMLDLFGVDDPELRAKLIDLAREGQRKGWWADYMDVLPAEECTYLGLEAAASLVRSFSVHVMPDLVQTEEYAAAVCRAARPGWTDGQVGRLVAALMSRQRELLDGRHQLWLVIDESVLLRVLGPGRLMARQMRHVLELASRNWVTIQVASLAGPRTVVRPSFVLLSFGDPADRDIAFYRFADGRSTPAARGTEVSDLGNAFEALAHAAMPPADSIALIERLVGVPE